MRASKFALTTAKILVLDPPAPPGEISKASPLVRCTLKWRAQRLWVSPSRSAQATVLPALNDKQWFKDCLDRSNVHAVFLSPDLGEAALTFWADMCGQARKIVFLRLPSSGVQKSDWAWFVKRTLDLTIAIFLILTLSPVLLAVAAFIRLESSGPILVKEWRVGQRGKLFRVFKFRSLYVTREQASEPLAMSLYPRTDEQSLTRIGHWMRKLGVDALPQLLNVLRGEMSLVGTPALSLRDATAISKQERVVLNALPGILGFGQVANRSHALNAKSCNILHLEYLHTWSLGKDFKIVLSVLGNIFSSFGCKNNLNQKLQ